MTETRRFPPPWAHEDNGSCFISCNAVFLISHVVAGYFAWTWNFLARTIQLD